MENREILGSPRTSFVVPRTLGSGGKLGSASPTGRGALPGDSLGPLAGEPRSAREPASERSEATPRTPRLPRISRLSRNYEGSPRNS